MSHEANDYLIRDGRFVRDFEAVYRAVADPWEQEATSDSDVLNATAFALLHALVRKRTVRSILDVGCATGYHAIPLLQLAPGARYTGIDVSPTAIARARQRRGGGRALRGRRHPDANRRPVRRHLLWEGPRLRRSGDRRRADAPRRCLGPGWPALLGLQSAAEFVLEPLPHLSGPRRARAWTRPRDCHYRRSPTAARRRSARRPRLAGAGVPKGELKCRDSS